MPGPQSQNPMLRQSALGWLSLHYYRQDQKITLKGKIKSIFNKVPARTAVFFIAVAIAVGAITFLSFWSNKNNADKVSTTPSSLSDNPVILPPKIMPESQPIRLIIPSIKLDTSLINTGQQADGSIQMPTRYDVAAWYDHSPTPGGRGPAIIAGHVDNWRGLGVFWRLKELKYGDTIEVTRADGSIAKFKVMDVKQFAKNNFPSSEVYGGINYSGIRLITCGGLFNHQTGAYTDNIVVFGKLQ